MYDFMDGCDQTPLITEKRSNVLDKLADCNAKELWNAVNKTRNKKVTNCPNDILRDPETVNEFFAEVSSKENYDVGAYMSWIYREKYDISDVTHPLTSIEVERMLSRIKLSASGCDDIPVWLLHQCTYELADIVAHIVNCSVFSGTVPSYWLNASVPKVPKPTGLSDFRPIGLSVTPLISRLTEKNHCSKMDITICSTRHVTRSVCFQTYRNYNCSPYLFHAPGNKTVGRKQSCQMLAN